MLAQASTSAAPDAATIFYITLLVIFLSAIFTAVITKWTRDKCLRFFHRFHVTLERARGQTLWGQLKVFSAGVEVVYDHVARPAAVPLPAGPRIKLNANAATNTRPINPAPITHHLRPPVRGGT